MSGTRDVAAIFRNAGRKKFDCPLCVETGFPGEYKIWEHAKHLHKDSLGDLDSPDMEEMKKDFVQAALEKAFVIPSPISRYLIRCQDAGWLSACNLYCCVCHSLTAAMF